MVAGVILEHFLVDRDGLALPVGEKGHAGLGLDRKRHSPFPVADLFPFRI